MYIYMQVLVKTKQLQKEGQIGEFILDLVCAILGIYYKVSKTYYGTAGKGLAKWRAKMVSKWSDTKYKKGVFQRLGTGMYVYMYKCEFVKTIGNVIYWDLWEKDSFLRETKYLFFFFRVDGGRDHEVQFYC